MKTSGKTDHETLVNMTGKRLVLIAKPSA